MELFYLLYVGVLVVELEFYRFFFIMSYEMFEGKLNNVIFLKVVYWFYIGKFLL